MRPGVLLVAAWLAGNAPAVAGDALRGEALFEQCQACHTMNGEHGVGPSLQGVIGRRAGSLADFRYSPAMRRAGLVWNNDNLDAFMADPQAVIRGNRMPFSGIEEAQFRSDIIAYLADGATPAPR